MTTAQDIPPAEQLVLPLTVVLVGSSHSAEQRLQDLRHRPLRPPCCHARAEMEPLQLPLQLETSVVRTQHQRHGHRDQRCGRQQVQRKRPRRQRPVRPHAAADALALEHMDLAEKIAANFARRTTHQREDLLQIAMISLIKAARRYEPSRGPFWPYGRTYANGEITHFLRDNGFLVKVPPTWREHHARGQRLLSSGVGVTEMLNKLGLSRQQWVEIVEACSVRVVALPVE
jgi:DNA-directed RNA polymerase sigma subunit (sigma70/sigma32)